MGRLVLTRAALVAVALLAGCYRPEVDSCFLRCGNNNACPDGLECNAQGVCATSQSTVCDELPGDADSQVPTLTRITLDVLGSDNLGQNDVRVLFSTPSGEMIADLRTPPTGHLVVDDIPIGSSVTIIRPTGGSYNATTHLDLWQDAHIVSRFSPGPGDARTVSINWQAPPLAPANSSYVVYTTCFTSEQTTSNLTLNLLLSTACKRFDVVVIAKNIAMEPLFWTAAANVDGDDAISFVSTTWRSFEGGDTIEANFMNTAGIAEMQVSGYLTPAYAYTTPLAKAIVPMGGGFVMARFPAGLGATIATTSSLANGTDSYEQLDVERLPVGTTSYERDFGARQFPWIRNARFDALSRTLTWNVLVTSGSSFVQPTVVYARIGLRRGNDSHEWRIFARGDRITASSTVGSFVFPEIPGDHPFEPIATDTNFIDAITYFGVTPGREDVFRGRIEGHDVRLDMFGIDGLTYIHRATAD